jgi:hypothetical protein
MVMVMTAEAMASQLPLEGLRPGCWLTRGIGEC